MAKICTQCNLKHGNDATKCVQCGGQLEVIQSDVKKRKIIISSLIAVVLVIVIVLGIVFFTGPKAKVRGIMRDFKQGDVEGIVDSFPEFFINYTGVGEEALEAELDPWVQSLSEYIFSYNIDKLANPSTREYNDVLASLDEYRDYGYDPAKLTDVKVVCLDMRGGVPGFWGSSFEKFVLIKYDGAWYWWPFY